MISQYWIINAYIPQGLNDLEKSMICLKLYLIRNYHDNEDVIKMETFSALLALCAGNSPVTGEFPPQRSVTRNFGIFFDLCLNKRFSKQSTRRWFETPSCSLWHHGNGCNTYIVHEGHRSLPVQQHNDMVFGNVFIPVFVQPIFKAADGQLQSSNGLMLHRAPIGHIGRPWNKITKLSL